MRLRRLISAIVDMFVLICIYTVIILIIVGIARYTFPQVEYNSKLWFDYMYYTLMPISVIVIFTYFFVCEYCFIGKSIGKLVTGLIVKSDFGSRISLLKCIFRTVAKVIAMFIYPITVIFILINPEKAFYDYFLNTSVVKNSKNLQKYLI